MFLIFGLAIGVLVASVVLRSACWIFNHLAGTHPKDYYSPSAFQARSVAPPLNFGGPPVETPPNPFAQPGGFSPQPATPAKPENPTDPIAINPYASPKSTGPGPTPNYIPMGGDLNHPDGVPEPTWPLSFGIVIVTYLVNLVVGVVFDVATYQILGQAAAWEVLIPLLLSRVVVNVLLSSAVLTVMLPTPYARALLVVLIEAAIGLLFVGVIFGVLFVTSGGLRRQLM